MRTQSILQNPVAKQMYDLKLKTSLAILNGRCREARVAQKEFAKIAVDNFQTAVKVPQPVTGTFPMFSKFGLNTIKFMMFKLFCKKTPQEKQLNRLMDDYKTSLYLDVH